MSEGSEALLRVEHLVKHFPVRRSRDVVHAVNDVSFEVHAGETVALVGESGSGKTTVGRCILKLIDATSGHIFFKGQDTVALSSKSFRKVRPRVQMIFQEPYDSLNPRFTIAQILEENLYLAGGVSRSERRIRARELLRMVQLPSQLLDAYPHELTGGEQQRVSIGRALSTEPDLIVLDEPTSALDISVRGDIIRLLARLQSETGISYLFISHDMTAVREISNRVLIMYLGEIVEVAPNPDIFNHQLHPYSKALLASVLLPELGTRTRGVTLQSEIPSPVNLPSGCYLHPRCPFAVAICTDSRPKLEMHGLVPGRMAACHRTSELLASQLSQEDVMDPPNSPRAQ
jgi:oligopeptide/dipeptide ABC transporter ATP-binding protein